MSTNNSDSELLRDLFMEHSREMKDGFVRLDSKIERLWHSVEERLKKIEEDQAEHSSKIEEHSHTFRTGGILFSALTVVSGLALSMWQTWHK